MLGELFGDTGDLGGVTVNPSPQPRKPRLGTRAMERKLSPPKRRPPKKLQGKSSVKKGTTAARVTAVKAAKKTGPLAKPILKTIPSSTKGKPKQIADRSKAKPGKKKGLLEGLYGLLGDEGNPFDLGPGTGETSSTDGEIINEPDAYGVKPDWVPKNAAWVTPDLGQLYTFGKGKVSVRKRYAWPMVDNTSWFTKFGFVGPGDETDRVYNDFKTYGGSGDPGDNMRWDKHPPVGRYVTDYIGNVPVEAWTNSPADFWRYDNNGTDPAYFEAIGLPIDLLDMYQMWVAGQGLVNDRGVIGVPDGLDESPQSFWDNMFLYYNIGREGGLGGMTVYSKQDIPKYSTQTPRGTNTGRKFTSAAPAPVVAPQLYTDAQGNIVDEQGNIVEPAPYQDTYPVQTDDGVIYMPEEPSIWQPGAEEMYYTEEEGVEFPDAGEANAEDLAPSDEDFPSDEETLVEDSYEEEAEDSYEMESDGF